MLDSLFLSFREGLEAALIIGIILATLSQLNRKHLAKVVGFGTIAGIIGSLILGWGLFTFAQSISHEAEEIMEAVMRIVAAGLIAYFILWLHRNQQVAGKIKGQTENRSSAATRSAFMEEMPRIETAASIVGTAIPKSIPF